MAANELVASGQLLCVSFHVAKRAIIAIRFCAASLLPDQPYRPRTERKSTLLQRPVTAMASGKSAACVSKATASTCHLAESARSARQTAHSRSRVASACGSRPTASPISTNSGSSNSASTRSAPREQESASEGRFASATLRTSDADRRTKQANTPSRLARAMSQSAILQLTP
jgi:hypothetical protein